MARTTNTSSSTTSDGNRSELQIAYSDFAKAYREKLSEENPDMKGKQKAKLISKAWKHCPENPNCTVEEDKSSKKKGGATKKKVTKKQPDEEEEEEEEEEE